MNIDWFLGFMWLDGQNIFGRRVRLVGQATKSETDHAGWVPWRLSTFTPYISFLFKSKISPGVFTSDSIVKDWKDWIQACFLELTLHAKPFQPKMFQKLAFATQKNCFPSNFRISLAHIPLCNNIVTQVSNYFSENKQRTQNTGLFGCTIL